MFRLKIEVKGKPHMVKFFEKSKSNQSPRRTALNLFTAALFSAAAIGVLHPTTVFAEVAVVIPAPVLMEPADPGAKLETAVVAGGCFWGMQAVFQHLNGVKTAVSGYAGGGADTAQYEVVSQGNSGHAESVKITFDPAVINFGTILQVYFSVAHNPTELNFQGPDHGSQYRSAVFPQSAAQKQVADSYIQQLGKSGAFKAPIVTTVEMSKPFFPAEGYHQNYATLHPKEPYISINDLPKVENLKAMFPKLYATKPMLVGAAG